MGEYRIYRSLGTGAIAWGVDELNSLDRKTIKLLTRYGILDSESEINREYDQENEWGEDIMYANITLEEYKIYSM